MIDVHKIMNNILSGYADADKWVGQPFENVKRLSNNKVGDIGQDFVEELCAQLELPCEFPQGREGRRSRTSPWDIKIEHVKFEIKTATEDVSGHFQFNHIRYHRAYDALLCIGIMPADVRFNAWSKADVTTGKAGSLVSMDKGSSATHKLTKRIAQLHDIDKFEQLIRELIAKIDA